MKILIHRACHYLYEKSPLIASIAFLLFINRHIFFQPFVPGADTIAKYDNFYFFYNEYFYHGHIAQWTPFVQHGMPAGYYQLDALGPSAYFAFILGKILQITDVSFLFKISVLVDLLALLLGMYLLAKEFFKSHFIVSVLCISVLCITDWQWEIGFQVYMRYLLPLAAYFFLGFYKKGRAGYFWVGWIIAFLSGMGASPYVQIIGLFSLFLLNLFLWWAYRPSWTKSREGAIHILPFIVLIILVFCVYHQLYAFRDFAATPNREIGQKNSLITFLMWEPWTQRGSLMVFLQDNIFGNYKNNFNYIGILPTLFLIYAVFTIRTREFLAFLFTGVAMWWLSCGGIFASLLYYFPCMAYYRNLGLAYNVYNVFFILCAGFGIQRFLDMPTRDKIKILAAGLIVLFLIADGLGFRTDWVRHLKIYKTLEVF
ncbi:MAG: hypothetical protein KGJ11_07595, partial [Candidatus Omnitrophica bacterium]|nr:hypothetical protein [Candidatus Omnitrophota bacterium]